MKADGFVKAIIDLEGEILGCHIIGPEASNLIQEVVVAMKAGSGTVQDIRQSVHIHPPSPKSFSGRFRVGSLRVVNSSSFVMRCSVRQIPSTEFGHTNLRCFPVQAILGGRAFRIHVTLGLYTHVQRRYSTACS